MKEPHRPVVIITGASSGIGAALARLLAHEGAGLVLGARRTERLNALVKELPDAVAFPCDVTVRADAERLVAAAIERFGRLDVLVNNAGRGHFATVEETTDEVIESMFRLNVYALWYTTRPALRQMKKQGTGHIITMASMAGKIGFGFNSAYVAAKHATVGFTMALRQELAETGIHASVVCPFGVMTDWASATEGGPMLPMFNGSGPVIKRIAQERGLPLPPMEGVIPAERVAQAIVDCIKHPVAEVYTHRGSHEFVVLANQNREEAEKYQLAVALGEREVYEEIRTKNSPPSVLPSLFEREEGRGVGSKRDSMQQRLFGTTGMSVSLIGFGAWGIGGAAMAGSTAIGWGITDDATSIAALKEAHRRGVTFFDTADFYGLGHSEELIGQTFGNAPDIVVATKVGHRAESDGTIVTDYSRAHILRACEASLRRLRRERIDFYQLHSARVAHFEQGECIEAMEQLQREGKIRFWGVSLNTFHPEPEAHYLMDRKLGHGFQLVLNIINQRAVPLLQEAQAQGYGIIARMPLQFGLLTGKFTIHSHFGSDDHRSYRLTPDVLQDALNALAPLWPMAERYGVTPATLALSYCASFSEVSTIIPGIKTPEQAQLNTVLVKIREEDLREMGKLYEEKLKKVMEVMERRG